MNAIKKVSFMCLTCGSTKLSYKKWISCQEDVLIHQNGHKEYVNQTIDDTNAIGVECRFICGSCGEPPMLYGDYIVTEDELNEYLEMSLKKRAEMQADFEQRLNEEAQIEEKLSEDEEIL
ncbi:MAG: hypothetical protein ACYC54_04665 [Sedimentisphaerales bacterium]